MRQGSLHWAVKTSFVHYVRTVAAGSCEVVDGAEMNSAGAFEFPLLEASESDEGRALSFGGGVRFSAHHGFLVVDLRSLKLTLAAAGGELGIATEEGDSVIIATMDPVTVVNDSGRVHWAGLVPRLTEAGVEVFGNVYPVGSEMAPLDAVVLLD
jgi:hypothetical protein